MRRMGTILLLLLVGCAGSPAIIKPQHTYRSVIEIVHTMPWTSDGQVVGIEAKKQLFEEVHGEKPDWWPK